MNINVLKVVIYCRHAVIYPELMILTVDMRREIDKVCAVIG